MDGDGGGWRSPAAAERGRIEETAGTTEGEVGEEREACQHFVRTSWRGKHKQTASESSRGREERGEVWSHLIQDTQKREAQIHTCGYETSL